MSRWRALTGDVESIAARSLARCVDVDSAELSHRDQRPGAVPLRRSKARSRPSSFSRSEAFQNKSPRAPPGGTVPWVTVNIINLKYKVVTWCILFFNKFQKKAILKSKFHVWQTSLSKVFSVYIYIYILTNNTPVIHTTLIDT